jgi:3',5'-cyclic AMP phosphodiesterase CpdA
VELVLALATVAFPYQRQIWSFLTHWKGRPSSTEPYVPFPPDARPLLRIAVAGDVGGSGSRIRATGAAMSRLAGDDPWDVLLLLGDNVYPAGNPDRLDDTVFGPFGPVLDGGAELLTVLGNHDVKGRRVAEMQRRLGMSGRWWSRTIGSLLVVGLDSTRPRDAEQRAWLERTLRGSHAPWKVVALHHPPYSAGYQGSHHAVRKTFVPLFERHGVQLVLSGHDHDYQRSKVLHGVTYVVSGAASGTRRTGEEDFTAVSFSWHHFVELDVFADRLVGRAVNEEDRVADTWTIRGSSG